MVKILKSEINRAEQLRDEHQKDSILWHEWNGYIKGLKKAIKEIEGAE